MKCIYLNGRIVIFLLFAVFLFYGCSGQDDVSIDTPEDAIYRISLKAVSGLQYDSARFRVLPGSQVALILTNEDDMDHNLVITRPGKRLAVLNATEKLGISGAEKQYIAETKDILWHTRMLKPHDSDTINFTAPEKKGVYPYVCTYPGHGTVMYGAMYVMTEDMPDMTGDDNIPEWGRGAGENSGLPRHLHPYPSTPPNVLRTYMPDSGPASISVQLTNNLSYCWDAGTCNLRYVWYGGFLHDQDIWQRKGDATPLVAGTVFYRNRFRYPMLIGNTQPPYSVQFKGYQLMDNYPEFHYFIADAEVYELIKPLPNDSGISRQFRILTNQEYIYIPFAPEDKECIEISSGRWEYDKVILSREEAKQFSISILKAQSDVQKN